MLPCKCKKSTQCKNTEVAKKNPGRIMFLSKCSVCNSKKSNCLKNKRLQDCKLP